MLRLWLPQSTLFIAEHDLQILDEPDLFKALEILCSLCPWLDVQSGQMYVLQYGCLVLLVICVFKRAQAR